jgi:large subunit ribosomal protein L22
MTEITHHTRNIRVAPRKLRLVVDKVRHQRATDALELLPLITKRGALHIRKSLTAAIAAAKDRDLDPSSLIVQRIWADEGPAMKRIVRHSRGRASGIMKKHSHLTIVLKGEGGAKPAKRAAKKAADEAAPAVEEEK